MGTLVLGYDDSAGAQDALRTAIDVAKALGDNVVVTFGYAPGGLQPGDELHAQEEAVAELGQQRTHAALEQITSEGVEAEAMLRPEPPAEALVNAADELDARAIVVGTYGESPLRGAILGSTPHKLLQLSKRPVVVVPPSGR
jgi:nucleotide-binding universal stress UspA family protein